MANTEQTNQRPACGYKIEKTIKGADGTDIKRTFTVRLRRGAADDSWVRNLGRQERYPGLQGALRKGVA